MYRMRFNVDQFRSSVGSTIQAEFDVISRWQHESHRSYRHLLVRRDKQKCISIRFKGRDSSHRSEIVNNFKIDAK